MKNTFKEQIVPLILTIVTFFVLTVCLYAFIHFLNSFSRKDSIVIFLRPQDVLVGLVVYLKTAIDFAIFIGTLMTSNPGWKKRIAIEWGTALGNGIGTFLILLIWNFFREVPLLMLVMILISSLILLRMAEESIEEFLEKTKDKRQKIRKHVSFVQSQLVVINNVSKPLIGKFLPEFGIAKTKPMAVLSLVFFSFTVPFLLGLDDFAGYIPLFTVVNVFGFAVGAFLGHMILNLGLFIAPSKTRAVVKNPLVLIIGGSTFVFIAGWGFWDIIGIIHQILSGHFIY